MDQLNLKSSTAAAGPIQDTVMEDPVGGATSTLKKFNKLLRTIGDRSKGLGKE